MAPGPPLGVTLCAQVNATGKVSLAPNAQRGQRATKNAESEQAVVTSRSLPAHAT